ncbi:MAG: HNH endonuclease [Devosia sp.]|uniref:HNH endonuclease n=1 Tax=Devosia sp. TaxID=1871048 RepID=UPI0033984B2F
MRDAIVFELRFLDAVREQVEDIAVEREQGQPVDPVDLRNRAYEAAGIRAPRQGAPRNVYERSADVKSYVLHRAQGHCEGCARQAPFLRPDRSHYLEPHHIRRVSDGGPDDPRFVIGLCPNCHRRVHAGIDGPAYNNQLLALMPAIEPPFRR